MKRPSPKLAVRDAGATKLRILAAARVEFADHGYMGARVDRIARNRRANKRLLYYYIGNKEALYLATLERATAGHPLGRARAQARGNWSRWLRSSAGPFHLGLLHNAIRASWPSSTPRTCIAPATW